MRFGGQPRSWQSCAWWVMSGTVVKGDGCAYMANWSKTQVQCLSISSWECSP